MCWISDTPSGNVARNQTCWQCNSYNGPSPARSGVDGNIYTRTYTKAAANSFFAVDFGSQTGVWFVRLIIQQQGELCFGSHTVYPKKYAHGFVVLCFVVVTQSFIMNSHEVFIHIHQGCFAGTGAIVRLPQCQWSKPDGYGKISQCITTTKHSKAKTVCIFLGIYCNLIEVVVS